MVAAAISVIDSSRVRALRARHAAISAQINEEQKFPATMDFYLKQLKKEKLFLKEEIEGISKRASA